MPSCLAIELPVLELFYLCLPGPQLLLGPLPRSGALSLFDHARSPAAVSPEPPPCPPAYAAPGLPRLLVCQRLRFHFHEQMQQACHAQV